MKSLTQRALGGFAWFLLVLVLLLFGPAWSITYGEAWVYLVLYLGTGLWITLYFLKHDPALIERRLAVGPKAEKEVGQKIIQGVAAVLVLSLYVVASLDHRFHWSEVPLAWVVLGDVGVVLGSWMIFVVFRENSFAAATIKVDEGQRVISTGPYGWVRHPMYTGSLVGFFAAALALGSWWALIPAGLLMVILVVRLTAEERFLAKNLAGYEEYRRKVRWRLVPYGW